MAALSTPIASAGGESGVSYPAGQLARVTARRVRIEESPSDERKKEIHKLALERFRTVCSFEADWRKRAEEELEFVDDLKHWTDAQVKERAGRPCLTFDQISGSIDQVVNNMRQAPPEPRVSGVGTGQDRVDGAVIQGVLRNIDNDCAAGTAWITAYEHACKIGRGWVEVDFEYEDDESFLQKIVIRRVPNWASVYPDPSACEFDYSDMGYCFQTETLSKEVFEDENPGAQWRPASDFESATDPIMLDWFPKDSIRVAKYWWIEYTSKTLYQLADGSIAERPPLDGRWVNRRTARVPDVFCAKMTGTEVLNVWKWPRGKFIPLIPVIGRESFIKGKRKIRGMIRAAMDANLAYDYARSKEAETVSLSSISQWIAGVKAIENHEGEYAESNRKAIAVLKYNERDEQNQELRPPSRISPAPASQAVSLAVEHADADRHEMLQTWQQSLGQPQPNESGRAIGLRQRQADNAHFHFADNLARSVRHATEIELALFPVIYSEERQVMMADPDGSQKIVEINREFIDPKTGMPKTYQFSDDTIRYHVTIGTGPSYPTRRAQQTDAIIQIGQAVPGAIPPVLDLLAQYLDLPDEFANRWRPPNIHPEGEEQAPTIEQMRQGMDQQAQLIQQLNGAVAKLSQDIATKRFELESKERIALESDRTQLAIAAVKTQADKELSLMRSEFDAIKHRLDLLHDNTALLAEANQPAEGQPPAEPAGAAPAEGVENAQPS
jgi:hypothetical protein